MVSEGYNRGYLIYIGFALANVAVSAGLLLLLANALPTEEYATFGVVNALAGLGLLVVNAGHKEALFKYASQSDDEALYLTAQSLQSWLMLFLLLATVLSALLLWVGLGVLMFLLVYASIATTAVFRGRAQHARDGVMWPLYRALWLTGCAAILFVGSHLSLTAVFCAGSLAAILTFFLLGGHRVVNELSAPALKFSWPFTNPTLRQFFFIEVATVAYIKVDVLLLAFLGAPPTDIASYFFSIQLFEAGQLLVMPLGYLFFNRINGTDIPSVRRAALSLFGGGVMLVSILVILGWSVIGMELLEAFFSNYVSSNTTMITLLWALPPWGCALLCSYWLIAVDRERLVARVFFIGFLSHLILNAIFISAWDVQGAAWARVVTECFIVLMLFAAATKTGSPRKTDRGYQALG